jgi:predicted dinucleotide-binding enzyme
MANRLEPTRVGVLGSGEVGRRLAEGFAGRGHDVMVGSRHPSDELRAWAQGAGVSTGSFGETADHGELIVLAVLGTAAVEALEQAGPERFAGKVVIDATNPLDMSRGFPPRLARGEGDASGGEQVQAAVPHARVVKAFNTIGNPYFVDPRFSEGGPTMFICGDDDAAKQTVADVVADFGWPEAIDVGPIGASAELESLCILWVRLGVKRGAWDHAFKLLVG